MMTTLAIICSVFMMGACKHITNRQRINHSQAVQTFSFHGDDEKKNYMYKSIFSLFSCHFIRCIRTHFLYNNDQASPSSVVIVASMLLLLLLLFEQFATVHNTKWLGIKLPTSKSLQESNKCNRKVIWINCGKKRFKYSYNRSK